MNKNIWKCMVFMMSFFVMISLGCVNVKAATNAQDPDVVSVKAVYDDGDTSGYDRYDTMTEEFFEENDSDENATIAKSTDLDGEFGSQLTDKALDIYNAIDTVGVSAEKNAIEYVVVTTYANRDTVYSEYKAVYSQALWAYYRDHLDTMFWVSNSGIGIGYSGSGSTANFKMTFTFSFTVSDYYTSDLQSSIDTQINKVVSACTGTTRYEKIKYYHDWLVNTNYYATSALSADKTSEEYYYAHSGVGCMVKGTGVCESYAKCFKTFCMKENIPCLFVSSSSHAWNYVRLENGKWYMVDCTYDDPNKSDGSTAGTLITKYFMVSNEPAVDTDHTVDDTFTYPTTDASAFSLCSSHSWNSGTVTKAATCLTNGEMTYTCTVCGDSKTASIAALGHDYKEVTGSSKEATCIEAGKTADQKCSRCDDVIEGTTIAALGHDYQEVADSAKEATCTEGGKEKDQKCSRCGDLIEGASIEALGHDYQEVAGSAKEATCTIAGKSIDKKCSRCGDVIEGTTIAALGHDYQEVAGSAKEATCTEDGKNADQKCSRCDTEIKGATIAALGHDYQEVADSAKEATCTEAGKTADQKCSRCDAEIKGATIAALGHDYKEVANSAKEATCTEAGKNADQKCSRCDAEIKGATIAALGHDYKEVANSAKEATCTEAGKNVDQKCSRCDAEIKGATIAALGHDYKEVANSAKEATCTEAGKEADQKCSRCGDLKTGKEIAALGHNYENVAGSAITATCVAAGKEANQKCSRCENVKTGKEIAALGHNYETVEGSAKAATCVAAGKEADQACSRCGSEITGAAIPATGKHTYDEGTVTTEATCTEPGVKIYTCTVCDATKTETIDALGHTWNDGTVTVKSTCIKVGEMTYTCKVCDATKTEVIPVDSKNHTGSTEIKNVKAATCGTKGCKGDVYCTDCGALLENGAVIPATGKHTYDSGKVTTAATNTSAGVKTYTCKVCGGKKTSSIKIISTVTLYKGVNKTYKLTSASAASWKITSGSKYASLKGRVLTVKATGTVKVYDSKSKKTVKLIIKNPTLTVNKTSITISKGKTCQLKASCVPTNTISWSTSKKTIATVNKNGKVTAKKVKGTCYIYVKANGLTKKVKVTVK